MLPAFETLNLSRVSNSMLKRFCIALLMLVASGVTSRSFAQESAQSLTRKLEQQFLAAPAISAKFSLSGQGTITVTADMKNNKLRIENAQALLISDGKTIWNYDKHANRVTIDGIAKNSALKDPASLFRFSSNYTAALVKSKGTAYTLELTPSNQLQSLLKAAGELQHIILDVKATKKNVTIVKASASSSNGNAQVSGLKITTLKSARASDFIFKGNNATKVIDLRE
jgi:outer membrane lipoprotein-sorting protein